jgi:6-phosphogluconolactonase/glucosamine-6-phosphate isomerase/deaminase
LVTGQGKAHIVSRLLNDDLESEFPASFVNPSNGELLWLLDKYASKLLDSSLIL